MQVGIFLLLQDDVIKIEAFSSLLTRCVEYSPVTDQIPAQKPMTWSFDVFFDLRLKTVE